MDNIKVNRRTLNLAIPFEIDTEYGIEQAYMHAAPLDSVLFNEFSSDLASVINQVFEGNPLLVACDYLSMVEAHISETRDEQSAKNRIARLNKIILSEISAKGTVVSSFTDFEPVPVGDAVNAGIITLDDLELIESRYLFFSRALRTSRSLVMTFAGSRLSAKDFGLELSLRKQSEESSSSSPAPSVSETSDEKVTPSFTEPLTASQDLPQASSPARTQRKIRAIGQSSGN